MATIQCKGCGKSYSDNPNLYEGEVHCPHCGLSVDGEKYVAHYHVPPKPGVGSLVVALFITAVAIGFLCLGKWMYPYSGWLLFVLIGIFVGIIAISVYWVFFSSLSDYDLATTDYAAYQALMDERQKKQVKRMEANQKQQEDADRKKYNDYKYRCPMCGSNKIGNLSTLSKAASIELFGAASKKLGKCYYCDNCKYMW